MRCQAGGVSRSGQFCVLHMPPQHSPQRLLMERACLALIAFSTRQDRVAQINRSACSRVPAPCRLCQGGSQPRARHS